VIFDEYHYGAWNDNAKGLFTELYEEGKDDDLKFVDKIENFDEEIMPITTDAFLYLPWCLHSKRCLEVSFRT
jgi:hypothetical protein